MKEINCELQNKIALSIEEAAAYSNIGITTIRNLLADEDCPFVLCIGTKKLVKRRAFEDYIESTNSIPTRVNGN